MFGPSRINKALFTFAVLAIASVIAGAQRPAGIKGVLLEKLTWVEAEKNLKPESVVVIAVGAESKEHGPHLSLNTDWLQAEFFKNQVLKMSDVVVAPTINYNFYPAFLEYPGSTSLRLETSRDAIVEICGNLARYGPRRFYIINIGISTNLALTAATEILAREGIVLRFLDLTQKGPIETALAKQERGSHADEIETSVMLYIAPKVVDMKKAVRDVNERKSGGLFTRNPDSAKGIYSPSGVWGDATLATREKGKKIVEELTSRILSGIEELRKNAAAPAATK
ncbi:MAG: creatininase family protein [Pyrinomonadaceae bacterium]